MVTGIRSFIPDAQAYEYLWDAALEDADATRPSASGRQRDAARTQCGVMWRSETRTARDRDAIAYSSYSDVVLHPRALLHVVSDLALFLCSYVGRVFFTRGFATAHAFGTVNNMLS